VTLWLMVSTWSAVDGVQRTITMGFVAPYSGRAGYTLTAPGATVAIKRAQSEGLLNDIDIRYGSSCVRMTHDAYSTLALVVSISNIASRVV